MQIEQSTRLRPDVSLHAAAEGHVLRVGAAHHHVHLDDVEADALLDALVTGAEPAPARARSALDSLVREGLVDVEPTRFTVHGTGALARALRASATRMGAAAAEGGVPVSAHDTPDDLPGNLPGDLPATGRACWLVDGDRVVVAPADVPPRDVAARHRAATRHHDADPVTAPRGRRVVAATSPAGLELAAVVVVAELLRGSAPRRAVVVDLHALTVTRHPVLPLPPAPA